MNAIDIREGYGERTFSDLVIQFLNKKEPKFLIANARKIITETRWDIFFRNFSLLNKSLQDKVIEIIKENDNKQDPNLLMYKWLPSINAKGAKNTKINACLIAKALKMSNKQYRQWLSKNRKKLNLIETNLTTKQYDKIDLVSLPKKAFILYSNKLNDVIPDKVNNFIKKIENKEIKVDISILNPIDVLASKLTNEQKDIYWKQQTNFLKTNFFPVIDVSASMDAMISPNYSAYMVAVALGLYTAERNLSSFYNKVMIFSNDAKVIEFDHDDALCKKVEIIDQNRCIANTNLDSVYEAFLNTALLIPQKIRYEAIPRNILIIFDDQFDAMVDNANETIINRWKNEFKKNNILMPKIIFWNVKSLPCCFPFKIGDEKISMISGFTPKILSLLDGIDEVDDISSLILREIFEKYYQKFDFSML